ncbi:hypothetical protein [Hydrogenophilus thermoluteolus]
MGSLVAAEPSSLVAVAMTVIASNVAPAKSIARLRRLTVSFALMPVAE